MAFHQRSGVLVSLRTLPLKARFRALNSAISLLRFHRSSFNNGRGQLKDQAPKARPASTRLGSFVETIAGGLGTCSPVGSNCQPIVRLGRGAPSAFRIHELLQERPILTIQSASKLLSMPFPAVAAALERLSEAGIVRETTGRLRGRIFAYRSYLGLLEQGIEPLPI